MDERVIYSIFQKGSDAAALGGVIEVLLLGGFFIFLILRLRSAKRNGHPFVSRSGRTTRLGNFLADHAASVIAAICCLTIALTFHLWNHYRADRDAMAAGNHQTLVGTLDGYRVDAVTRFHHTKRVLDGVAGLESTLREQDAIVVKHRTFYVACDRPLDMPLPTIGDEGRCLALRTGQEVRIDFIETSNGSYRTEPLRISVIGR